MIDRQATGVPAEALDRWSEDIAGVWRAAENLDGDPVLLAKYIYDRCCDYHGQAHDVYARELIATGLRAIGSRRLTAACQDIQRSLAHSVDEVFQIERQLSTRS